MLVLKFADGPATLKDAVDLLRDVMDEHNAECILVGGALSARPNALARAYRMLGFEEQSYPELIMWR